MSSNPKSIAGVPFYLVGSLRITLLLRTTCICSCCNYKSAICVVVLQTKNQKPILFVNKSKVHCGSTLGPGASGLPYYCTPLVCVPAVIGRLAVWCLFVCFAAKHQHDGMYVYVCMCVYVCVCVHVRPSIMRFGVYCI